MSGPLQIPTTTKGAKVASNGETSLRVGPASDMARPSSQKKMPDTADHVPSIAHNGTDPSDGDASQPSLSVGPVSDMGRPLSPQELSDAFVHVPWMEFNVTARPNIKTFSSHPAIRQVISQVAHGTLDDIKDAITANVMNSINDIVSKAVKDATGDVPKHVMNNINKTFSGFSIAPTDTPTTNFQRLQSPGMIDDYDLDNASNRLFNINFGHDNGDHINFGHDGDNIIFPVTPGPFPSRSIPNPDIGTANWIWTNEQPFDQPPGNPRAFRKAAALPAGQVVDSMIIDITCDNWYTLYVNGFVVGNGTNWGVVQRYSITFPRTSRVLVAVYASNDPVLLKQAGLIASAVMWNSKNDSGRTFEISTDATWKTSITAASSGFEKPNYAPDSSWMNARVEGPYGMLPWGAVPKPTKTDPVTGGFSNLGIPNPPSAPLARPGPDSDGKTAL